MSNYDVASILSEARSFIGSGELCRYDDSTLFATGNARKFFEDVFAEKLLSLLAARQDGKSGVLVGLHDLEFDFVGLSGREELARMTACKSVLER